MRRVLLPLLLPISLLTLTTPALAAEPIEGRWLTAGGRSIVAIERCGKTICGRVFRILAPTPEGTPHDKFNPDPRLRNRPVLGLEILSGFSDGGSDWRGTIYDPEHGKTYKSILKREPGGLNVKGCIMMFCQGQHWTPAK